MWPRNCTALVAVFTALTLAVLWVGFCNSLRVHLERARHYEWVEEEIRRLDGQDPARESVLRDNLLESLYFGEKLASWYDFTLLLALPLSAFSFLLCCYQKGSKRHKVSSWAMWCLAALLLVLFAVHNLIALESGTDSLQHVLRMLGGRFDAGEIVNP